MTIKNIAIILASGMGTRFGAERPKQFIKLAGKTVLEFGKVDYVINTAGVLKTGLLVSQS